MLILVIVLVLAAEGVLVALVFFSPTTTFKLQDRMAAIERSWNGTKGHPGYRTRLADDFKSAYDDWIAPMFASNTSAQVTDTYAGCVKCHKDYATTKVFNGIYISHPLHAQMGVTCQTCHPETDHPNPPLPLESTCAKCHTEVNTKGQCGLCHAPASLPHFYLLGAPRQGPVDCSTCHPTNMLATGPKPPLVDSSTFTGRDPAVCLRCHQAAGCISCHQVMTPTPGSPHPADWVSLHPQVVIDQGGLADCYTCHTVAWCADKCHAVVNRIAPPLLPLPTPPPPA
jgi:hypothetical protein